MAAMQPSDAATPVVSAFYDCFPFPGDPLQDGPPPGYNWRWCHRSVMAAVHGVLLQGMDAPRILDAGCGTGVSTDYLCHLNPDAEVLAVDISEGALDVAKERLKRSGAETCVRGLRQEQRSLLDLAGEGPFDYINSVGVLHHLDQPMAGLEALAGLLAPCGLLHLFLYADAGRWEIHRTQQALNLLGVGTGLEGLRLGRQLFETLPAENRLRRQHEQRWAVDCAADANFADMYLHPQETSFNLGRLFSFIEHGGLHFAGFSNPEVWNPSRLLHGELLARAKALPPQQQWALIEQLDPEISHFEFFLSAAPIQPQVWGDAALQAATAVRQPCLWGEPDPILGLNMEPLQLTSEAKKLLRALPDQPETPLGELAEPDLIRDLVDRQLILLRA
ncbi:MAG: SAM-dependent methyltransferase [Cyanobium sp. NAT70]|nr:SAM-dependent methyltransferase [Cyanobium sp. NAT70]|tara:strand:+ start:130 stop:1299 length:1170 start_codon:yes stop_codon:yes gene_type:complete